VRAELTYDQVAVLERGVELEEGIATLQHLRSMTAIETERLEELLFPPPAHGLVWYRATLRQGWKRQLRRVFGAVEAPIERLVRVRIGPVRIDGLRSGHVRRLKAPEVRGLGGGGGRSRGDNRTDEPDSAAANVETATPTVARTARPRAAGTAARARSAPTSRPGGPARIPKPRPDAGRRRPPALG
ncbi:MAG: hypothetical protein ABIZ72_03845, partial [Candidatus Limnocylindrales bacterium]